MESGDFYGASKRIAPIENSAPKIFEPEMKSEDTVAKALVNKPGSVVHFAKYAVA